MPKAVSKETQKSMVRKYLSGGSSQVIAERYGLDRHTCLAAVRRSGNKVRLREESRRRHKVKRDYFDIVDTERKAYWLGFATADGCVSDYKLAFHLSICDRGHLGKELWTEMDGFVNLKKNMKIGRWVFVVHIGLLMDFVFLLRQYVGQVRDLIDTSVRVSI